MAARGEGMVVKLASFVSAEGDEALRPAVERWSAEYLRIIPGPEHLEPRDLERFRKRSLGRKRSPAPKGEPVDPRL